MALPVKGSPEWDALAEAWAQHRREHPTIPGPGLHAEFDRFADAWLAEQE